MVEKEIGTITGEAKSVAPIVIEGGTFLSKGIVPGESADWSVTVRNNSQVEEYQLRYNITFGTVEPDTERRADLEPFVNGQKYKAGSWVLIRPQSKHDVIIRITILPDCPIDKIVRFNCRVWEGEELIE